MRFAMQLAGLLSALALTPAALATGQTDYNTYCSGCHGQPVGTAPTFTGVTGSPLVIPTSLASIVNASMAFGQSDATLNGIVAYLNGTSASAPVAALSQNSVSFGNQQVGTSSAPTVVTLSNTGTAALSVTAIAVAAPFAQTNTCGTSVAAGASCTISISFAPTAATASNGNLTLTDGATSSPQTVALSGTGVQMPAPAATLSTNSLVFGSVTVGSSSAAQAVTLTNTGNAALSVSSIAATGAFAQSNNCGMAIAASQSCTISVTFTPTAASASTGTLTINDAAAGGSQSVALSGMGTATPAPSVAFTPTSLTFASQTIGSSSAVQPVTLQNSGLAALPIASIAVAAPFTETNNCGSSLAAGASCVVQVGFVPTAVGTATATLMVTDGAAGSPHGVALTGTGNATGAAAVTLSAATLSFGSQAIGAASSPQSVTVTNSGSSGLMFSTIGATGDFSIGAGTCATGVVIAAGASCNIQVSFMPTATGSRTGTLTIASNASGSASTVSLLGTGTTTTTSNAMTATITPMTVIFGPQLLNTAGTAQTVVVSNTSSAAALTISAVMLGGSNPGDFTQSSSCGATLAAGATCAITVNFKPTAAGARSASLMVASNATGPLVAALSGTGISQSAAILRFDTGRLAFRPRAVGTTSRPKALFLSNTGTSTLHISSMTVTGDFVKRGSSCGATLAPGAHCHVLIAFAPVASGHLTGALEIASDTSGRASSVRLTGFGGGSSGNDDESGWSPANDDQDASFHQSGGFRSPFGIRRN